AILHQIWGKVVDITGKDDFKLQKLIALLEKKIDDPFNPGNRKVIIFTAFADTANYLYSSIQGHLKRKYNINSALITGSRKTSNAKDIPNELNHLLTCFSPISKGKANLYGNISES